MADEAADVVAALVAFLQADAGTSTLVDARVFGGELPANQTGDMPRKALVVTPSGGASTTGDSFAEFDSSRFDLFGFGETPKEADRVIRAAALAMRGLRRSANAGVLLISANSAGGSQRGREPQTEWPRTFQSFQVFHGLKTIQ